MSRAIWATVEKMPFSDSVMKAAKAAGATEVVELPCPALPQLSEGFNIVPDKPYNETY